MRKSRVGGNQETAPQQIHVAAVLIFDRGIIEKPPDGRKIWKDIRVVAQTEINRQLARQLPLILEKKPKILPGFIEFGASARSEPDGTPSRNDANALPVPAAFCRSAV